MRPWRQIPEELIEEIELLLRADSAGATHELIDWCREARIGFSVGYDLTEPVRCANAQSPPEHLGLGARAGRRRAHQRPSHRAHRAGRSLQLAWGDALDRSSGAPAPRPQLSFTDHDGYRFQAFLTDQDGPDIAVLERRQRQRARVEDQIRDDKDTGLAKLPFKDFAMNHVWLELVLIAHNLLSWTKTLLLEGALQKACPKRLRHRLLHTAGRLAFHGRRARLRLQRDWPWAPELAQAFIKPRALPAPAA
jgi:hypothetical protein